MPAGHTKHAAIRVLGAKVPKRQGVGAAEPDAQLVPLGQSLHSSTATRLDSPEYVPVGHGCGAALPIGQYVPLEQTFGSDVALGQKKPPGHRPAQLGPEKRCGGRGAVDVVRGHMRGVFCSLQ